MGVLESFVSRTSGDATLAGKISGIFPHQLGQSTPRPGISYFVSSDLPSQRLSDQSETSLLVLQLNIVSESYSTLDSITTDIIRLWKEYRGVISGVNFIRTKIQINDNPPFKIEGSDNFVYERNVDITIRYGV